jgi:hypothetical protein
VVLESATKPAGSKVPVFVLMYRRGVDQLLARAVSFGLEMSVAAVLSMWTARYQRGVWMQIDAWSHSQDRFAAVETPSGWPLPSKATPASL